MCYTYISIYFNLGLLTNISARWPGSTHDSHVFRTSAIGIHLQNRYREYIKVFFWVTVGIHAGHSFLYHTDNQWGLRNNDSTAAMYQPDPQ